MTDACKSSITHSSCHQGTVPSLAYKITKNKVCFLPFLLMAGYSRGKSLLSELDFIYEQGYSKTLSCCRVMGIVKEYSHAWRIGENGIDLSLCFTMQESYNTSYTEELEH